VFRSGLRLAHCCFGCGTLVVLAILITVVALKFSKTIAGRLSSSSAAPPTAAPTPAPRWRV